MRRKRLIAISAICLIGLAIFVLRDRHFAALAETYRQQAMKESSASTTPADAKAWLERNGFKVALYGENVVNELTRQTPQGQEEFNIVNGYHQVASSAIWERWVHLIFLFQKTEVWPVSGRFVGVEVEDNRTPPLSMKNEFARRAAIKHKSTTSAER